MPHGGREDHMRAARMIVRETPPDELENMLMDKRGCPICSANRCPHQDECWQIIQDRVMGEM